MPRRRMLASFLASVASVKRTSAPAIHFACCRDAEQPRSWQTVWSRGEHFSHPSPSNLGYNCYSWFHVRSVWGQRDCSPLGQTSQGGSLLFLVVHSRTLLKGDNRQTVTDHIAFYGEGHSEELARLGIRRASMQRIAGHWSTIPTLPSYCLFIRAVFAKMTIDCFMS